MVAQPTGQDLAEASWRPIPLEYNWKTLNLSPDTYGELLKLRKERESMNDLVRRILGLTVPDPSRIRKKLRTYYKEDR